MKSGSGRRRLVVDRAEVDRVGVVDGVTDDLDAGFRRENLLDQLVDAAAERGILLQHVHCLPAHLLGEHVLAEVDIEYGQCVVVGHIHEVHFVLVVFLDDLVDDADIRGPGVEGRRPEFRHTLEPAQRHVVDAARNDEVHVLDFIEIFVSPDALLHVLARVGHDELDHAPAKYAAGGVELLDGDLGAPDRALAGIGIERADIANLDGVGSRRCRGKRPDGHRRRRRLRSTGDGLS